MCSRIVALVLSVTLHILTVKNLYRVVNGSLALSNALPGPALAVRKCVGVGTGSWRFWYPGDVQKGRDIGFHCHSPYTNSQQLHKVATVSHALSNASPCSIQ